jgi:hypothetical protein
MRAKQEQAVTWWNPATQMQPVLDSSSFAPIPMLPRRTCLHSASSILTVHISCRVIAVFVFRKPLFINKTLPYLCLLHAYHVIYSVRYYPRFHVTVVGLGTYYPRIRGHYCTHSKLYSAFWFIGIPCLGVRIQTWRQDYLNTLHNMRNDYSKHEMMMT